MTEITTALVKELREKTGAGMMDCKKALNEADGSIDQAIEVLRKKGLKDLDKRTGKVAAEGTIGVYVHQGSQVVGLVELNCETDFVAKGDDFQETAKNLAMHVAAMKPLYLNEEEVPEAVIEKEKEIVLETLNDNQKDKIDKILPGKLAKFYSDTVLLNQAYVRDDSGKKMVKDVLEELGVKCGEKIVLRRFYRVQVGEGIEKAKENFAEEVASMTH